MSVLRSGKNPIIKPEDIIPSRPDLKVIGVFNCAVTRFNGEVLLLMRVAEKPVNDNKDLEIIPLLDLNTGVLSLKEFDRNDSSINFSDPRFLGTPTEWYLTSISHLRIARSKNGIDFEIDKKPAIFPENVYDRYGIEDPRITYIDGKYYINYSAVSDITGITICLASTTDFIRFIRHGVIFLPDNKNGAIFPEKINGKYYALNRPSPVYGSRDIWISESSNLICWGNHKRLMGSRREYWDEAGIGAGAVPFKIKEGWLEIYHGSSMSFRYCLGAVLLDINEPWKIISRSEEPLMEPEMEYELKGFFENVVFSCGALYEENKVKIYYGAADTSIAYAEIDLDDILDHLK